jgi:hypothetical protein
MFLWICLAVAAVVVAYFVYDWRRASRLKRDLALGTGQAPDPSATPGPDARHGLDAHQHHSKSIGNQAHGQNYF